MINHTKPLTEQAASDLRALIDALRGNRERYRLADRRVEVRSCDLEIAEATRALAIINRRATEAEDQRTAQCLTQRLRNALADAIKQIAIHNAEYKHVTPGDLVEAWRALIVEVEGAPAQREADLREAFVAGCQFAVGRVRVTDSGAGPSLDTPTVGDEDDAAAEYARGKAGG